MIPGIAEAQVAPAVGHGSSLGDDLRDEVARLRAEVDALRAELRGLRAETATTAVQTPSVATAMPPPAPTPATAATAPSAIQINWRGTPEFRTADGWSFKLRGRLQIDGGYLGAPGDRFSGQADGRGFTSRLRRAYLGVQGSIPGGFNYRIEADFAGNAVNWNDLVLSYRTGPVTFTVGQHHPFTSMEQLQSDLFLSFNERASFVSAFNLERRVGLSAQYARGSWLLDAGIFTDDVTSLTNDGDHAFSVDGRVVWMPRFGNAQLHFGASAHYRELGDFQATLGNRYRARPYIATTDIRYVDTGILTVDRESQLGAEFAANRGRLHLAAEASWLTIDRPGPQDPTFFGGYAEAGIFLTPDTRSYRAGIFDRVTPTHPLGGGGIGALELNARYDRLDLTDAGIGGGTQDAFGLGLVWTPVAYVRFNLNYMHLIYDIPSAQPIFDADVIGTRAQIDF